jgi:DNA-binding NarL/FixJ family response regulator
MINVLIVDDHPLITKGLRDSLEESESIHVCAITSTVKQCYELFESCNPDVVVLDIKLPDGSGMDVCKELFLRKPAVKIIMLTSYNQKYFIRRVIKSGVQGYLLKSSETSEIIEAIIHVFEGENYFCKEVLDVLHEKEPSIYLGRREIEVLELIAKGFTNQDISEKLFISPSTVDTHRKNLIMKLGAKNTASLISIATEDGYL